MHTIQRETTLRYPQFVLPLSAYAAALVVLALQLADGAMRLGRTRASIARQIPLPGWRPLRHGRLTGGVAPAVCACSCIRNQRVMPREPGPMGRVRCCLHAVDEAVRPMLAPRQPLVRSAAEHGRR